MFLTLVTPMTADYASALKKAWEACPCKPPGNIDGCKFVLGRACNCFNAKHPKVVTCTWPGHAALLEMVDAHCEEAACNRWSNDSMEHHELRRRLRAAVGVDE